VTELDLRIRLQFKDDASRGMEAVVDDVDDLQKAVRQADGTMNAFGGQTDYVYKTVRQADGAISQVRTGFTQLTPAMMDADKIGRDLGFTLQTDRDALNEMGDAAEDAGDSTGLLENAIEMAKTALIAFAGRELVRTVAELGRLGAEAQRSETAFQNISGGALAASDNLEAMRTATRGALSDIDAMSAANQLMQMGLVSNADELEEVTTAAVRLGTAMGRTANESISEFAALLANQSLPRLDTFGISSGKVRSRILELQAATEGLSREQAFNIAVMEEAERAMGRLGDAQEDQLLVIERNQAAWKNLKVEVGQVYSEFIALGGFMPTFLQDLADNVRLAREAGANFSDLGTNLVIFADALGITIPTMDRLRQQQEQLRQEQERINAATALGEGQMRDYAEMAGEVGPRLASSMAASDQAVNDLNASMTELQGKSEEAQKQIIFGFVQMAAAADGVITEDELDVMQGLAHEWGLIDDAAVEALNSARGAIDNVNSGLYGTEEAIRAVDGAFRGLPTEHSMRIHVDVDDINLPGWSVPGSVDIGDRAPLPGAGTPFSLGDERERGRAPTPNAGGAIPQAEGGDWIVRRPTLFLAGEGAMPERATFTPLHNGSGMEAAGSGGDVYQLNMTTMAPLDASSVLEGFEMLQTLRGGLR
jgi:hypothetical protein